MFIATGTIALHTPQNKDAQFFDGHMLNFLIDGNRVKAVYDGKQKKIENADFNGCLVMIGATSSGNMKGSLMPSTINTQSYFMYGNISDGKGWRIVPMIVVNKMCTMNVERISALLDILYSSKETQDIEELVKFIQL